TGLACVELAAIIFFIITPHTTGDVSGYTLLAVGLTNAIMFPTIFTLACEKLGSRAADGSGIINVAIVGGAVIPLLTGIIADLTSSLALAFMLPMACYAVIAGFGFYARRPA
ncbi:MAG: glucose/galactose MFS transporter, partial [Sphingorhabdus sp.]